MRQAGRYLPEYQALRKKHTFWELMRTPKLAKEVTLQPIRRYGMDCAILFCDILVVLDAMGLEVSYGDKGPVISPLVQNSKDLTNIKTTCGNACFDYVGEIIELLCQELHPHTGVIGFAGAPFTLAAYMLEGGPAKNVNQLKSIAYNKSEFFEEVISRIAQVVADLLRLQIKAGADVIQLFDTWAWHLSPDDYQTLALPYTKMVFERLADLETPKILYIRNAAGHLEDAASSGCDLLSVDSSIRLADARKRLDSNIGLQGNLDPAFLTAAPKEIEKKVEQMIKDSRGAGYIVNLGQGLNPDSPIEGVAAFVEAVKNWKR
jgi:uroporphyrinogen decarboxylase